VKDVRAELAQIIYAQPVSPKNRDFGNIPASAPMTHANHRQISLATLGT
jgi:hypothetical protein